jgi:hypothetical protein
VPPKNGATKFFTSPILLFVGTLLLVCILTVVLTKVWDTEPALAKTGTRPAAPFPNAFPQVMSPPQNPVNDNPQCVVLQPDARGALHPSPSVKLISCTNDTQCELGCDTKQHSDYYTVKCEKVGPGTSYPDVQEQQAKLGVHGTSFCLPEKHECMGSTDPNQLQTCAMDSDCVVCNDDLPNQEVMTCQEVPKDGARFSVPPMSPTGIVDVPNGKFCLPKIKTCNFKNGFAEWTENEGWKCICNNPNVMGGDDCNTLIACQADLTTADSQSQNLQTLLVNQAGPLVIWHPGMGIDPEKCYIPEDGKDVKDCKQVVCSTENNVPTTVCRCQGRQVGTGRTFVNIPDNPLSCVVDSCNVGPLGGTSTPDLLQQEWSTTQPKNRCICSGANSMTWKVSTDTGKYSYVGYCDDFHVPVNNSKVTIPKNDEWAKGDMCKNRAQNNYAQDSQLVPGRARVSNPNDPNAPLTYEDVCSPDPCTGKYGDPNFSSTVANYGHFDATSGECLCTGGARAIPSKKTDKCDNTENPVCNTCVNACVNMGKPNAPCKPLEDPPGRGTQPLCSTNADGGATCTCPAGSTDPPIYGKYCASTFDYQDACEGFVNVPGICKKRDDDKTVYCINPKRTGCSCSSGPVGCTCCSEGDGKAQCLTTGKPDYGSCETTSGIITGCGKHSKCL